MSTREEEQQLPLQYDIIEYSQDTLSERMKTSLAESKRIGIQRYGSALQPFNGRDSFRDMWEEMIDLAVYMENVRREREELVDILIESRNHAKLTQNGKLQRRIEAALEGMGTL